MTSKPISVQELDERISKMHYIQASDKSHFFDKDDMYFKKSLAHIEELICKEWKSDKLATLEAIDNWFEGHGNKERWEWNEFKKELGAEK